MSNVVFPTLPGLSWGMDWEPEFSTKIQTATSGKEYRASQMSSPIYSITLQYEFLRAGSQQELQILANFFLARQGAFDNFLWVHPNDNAQTDQVIGVANGTQTTFQLLRSFGAGFVEPVQNVSAISNIKVNGVVKTLGSDYTVSSTGLVLFSTAPNTGNVTWTGSFYYRARFALDKTKFTNFMKNLYSAKSVELRACLGTKI